MPKVIVQYIGPGNVRHEVIVPDEEAPKKKPAAKKKTAPKKSK